MKVFPHVRSIGRPARVRSPRWLMEETGQPYERVLTDIFDRRAAKARISRDQSDGRVPALKDGEATWRAPQSAPMSPEPLPEQSWRRGWRPLRTKYLYWLFFSPGCIEPAMVQIATKVEMNPVAAGWATRNG